MLDDPEQTLAGTDQPLEDGGSTGSGLAGLMFDADTAALLQADSALCTDGPLLAVVRCRGREAFFGQGLGEDVLHLVLSVDDEHPLGFRAKGIYPGQQAVPVGVTRKTGELADLCLHLDGLAEQFHVGGTFDQGAAQRSDGLITDKQNRTFRPPQVVLQVVADAACLAHAAGRDDDLGHPVGVDHPGFIAGHADPQPRELDGIDALRQKGAGLLIEAVGVGILENAGRLDGKGAVDVDGEIPVAGDETFFLDFPDEIEQLLGAAHRKAGDDHIAAPVKGALQDLRQLTHIVRPRAVGAVAVGGLHKDVIRILDVGRVLDDGLMLVADIAAEHQLGGGAVLGHPDLDAGRAQQVAHIHEPDNKAGGQFYPGAVIDTAEQLHGCLGILHGIHGFHRLGTGALALAVLPLGLKLLNVGRIPQHDAAQLGRGLCGIDPAPESVAYQQGQQTGVVDVCVGDQHTVDLPRCHRDGLVLVDVLALLHPAVDQVALSGRFQQRTAAGDLMVRAQKCDFHRSTSRFQFHLQYSTSAGFLLPKSCEHLSDKPPKF